MNEKELFLLLNNYVYIYILYLLINITYNYQYKSFMIHSVYI